MGPGGDLLEGVRTFDFVFETSKFDLTLFVTDLGEELLLHLEYDTELFAAESIREGLRALERFAGMVVDPSPCEARVS